MLSDTFETAITWDRFADFHAEVMETARKAVAAACGAPAEGPGSPRISCRFTHVYPDGPAPYYTVLAPARRGSEVEQWDEIKAAVSEAVIDAGGTITHHHAVGRDHRPWYDRQRPEPFAAALRAAKAELDPAGILNPGVLIDPASATCSGPRSLTLPRLMEGTTLEQTPAVSEEPTAPTEPRSPAAARCARRSSPCARRSGSRTCSSSRACCSRASSTRSPRSLAATRHLPRLLRGRLGRLPDQRRPRRRAGPPAPEEAPPPDRRRRARHPHRDHAGGRAGRRRPRRRRRRSRARWSAASSLAYGVGTTLYSYVLKHEVILDVMTIAGLFVLRVLAGAVAVDADASAYLLLCTGMVALFLGFTKRRQEATSELHSGTESRPGAGALLDPLPRPDGGDGDRGDGDELRDLLRQLAADRLEDARHPARRSSTGSSATST